MAAPTIAQRKVSRLTANNTTLTLTFDSPVVTGSLIVLFVCTSTDYAGWGISDQTNGAGGSNTYTLSQGDGFGTVWGKSYTAVAGSSGTLTITLTLTSGLAVMHAFEVNNYAAAGTIEKSGKKWENVDSLKSPYHPLDANFGATTAAEQLFLGVMCWNTAAARTWDGGGTYYTTLDKYTAGDSMGSSSISYSSAATGTYTPTWVGGAGGHDTITIAMSIVAGSAGPGGGGGGGGTVFLYQQVRPVFGF